MKNKLLCLALAVLSIVLILSFSTCATQNSTSAENYLCAAKNQEDGVFIKWVTLPGAESYTILRKAYGDAEFTALRSNLTSNTFLDESASSGTRYTYKALYIKNGRELAQSTEITICRLDEPVIKSVKATDKGLSVSWSSVEGADKYTLYYKAEGDSAWSHTGYNGAATSFVHTGLKSAQRYTYTVRARSGSYTGSYAPNGVSAFYLEMPRITKTACVQNGIKLTIRTVEDADSYVLYRRAAGKTWSKLTTLEAGTSSYTDTTAQAGITYAYTIRAVKGTAMSSFVSSTGCRFIPVNNVTAAKCANGGLKLYWSRSPYATGYKLYKKNPGDSAWTRIAVLEGRGTTSYIDKNATSGKAVSYTLISVCGKYQSTFNPKGYTATYIKAPQLSSVTRTSSGITIKWEKLTGATHYYIYRRASGESEYTKLTRTGNTNTYTDKTAGSSKKYYYCLRARAGEGPDYYYSVYGKELAPATVDPDKKMVALTYDDGPHNTYTNKILDVLEKYDAKATFFVVGSRISSHHAPLERAAKMGCEIGNHSYNHPILTQCSESTIRSELNKTDELIKKYTGSKSTLMRPPGGSTNDRVLRCISAPAILWSVDTRDWDHRNASTTVSHIKSHVYDGAIILMHDIYSATASATETIVPWLIRNGYQLVTVSELMEYKGINMKDGVIYRQAR